MFEGGKERLSGGRSFGCRRVAVRVTVLQGWIHERVLGCAWVGFLGYSGIRLSSYRFKAHFGETDQN